MPFTVKQVADREGNCSEDWIRKLIRMKRVIGVSKVGRDYQFNDNYVIKDGSRGPKRRKRKDGTG